MHFGDHTHVGICFCPDCCFLRWPLVGFLNSLPLDHFWGYPLMLESLAALPLPLPLALAALPLPLPLALLPSLTVALALSTAAAVSAVAPAAVGASAAAGAAAVAVAVVVAAAAAAAAALAAGGQGHTKVLRAMEVLTRMGTACGSCRWARATTWAARPTCCRQLILHVST
jgi:hypothetical protein